jgi:hypothetical protein
MKDINKAKFIQISLYSVFLIGLLITMLIILYDIDTPLAFSFIVGFVIFLILFVLFQLIFVILNIKQLPSVDLSRIIIKFLVAFVFFMTVTWLLNYFFRPEAMDRWDFGIPLGLALGISFADFKAIRKKQ